MSSSDAPTPRVANRYGTPKPGQPLARARLLIIAVLVTAVAAVAWVALTTGNPSITYKDVGFSVGETNRASVDFEVTKDARHTAQCAVQTLSENFAVVGWRVVTIGPEDGSDGGRTTAHRTDLRTDSPAVSGGVESCWIVEET